MKIILGQDYVDYESSLQKLSLETLQERRQKRLLNFSLKCIEDKYNNKMFPKNERPIGGEIFKVNFARTNKYFYSTIPQAQRMVNKYYREKLNKH